MGDDNVTENRLIANCERLATVIAAMSTDNPTPDDVAEAQKLLDDLPEVWVYFGDVNLHVQSRLVERIHGTKLGELALRKGIEVVREGLGYKHACQMEQLLIDHLVTCWLRWQEVEWRYSCAVCSGSAISPPKASYWERRLSAAQRRFLRSVETLARVRKLVRRTPALQINVATRGGQQVNVAGEMRVEQSDKVGE